MRRNKYIEFIMRDSINQYAVKNSKVKHIHNVCSKPGKVAATFSKECLSDYGVKGIIFGSIEKIVDKELDITHWTPNPFTFLKYNENKRITEHKKENLKQLNTFVIDIDKNYTENTLKECLISAHIEYRIPLPNLYVETPRGWHLYYVLDKPLYMNREKRSLYVAENVQKNILRVLNNYVEVDINCVPFGFYRLPTDKNVRYFTNEYISKDEMIEWSIDYSKNKKDDLKVVYGGLTGERPEWVNILLNLKNIEPKNGFNACRNNTVFTLALYFYSIKEDFEKTFNILDEFNSNLNTPLNTTEMEGIIKSAYSGKYKAPNKEHIQIIVETWTNEDYEISDNYFKTFYKHKKKRSERVRSHYEERIEDFITYLENNTDHESLYIEGSIKDILARFNMPKSTFYDILNTLINKNVIYKQNTGYGRYSKTRIALFNNILKRVLKNMMDNRIKKAEYKSYLESILPSVLKTNEGTSKGNKLNTILGEILNLINPGQTSKDKVIVKNTLII